MFAGTILPVDSGAYPLALELSGGNLAIANFSGVVLGSTFGCIAGGLAMNMTSYKISFMEIMVNLIPVIIVSVLVAIGLALRPKQLMNAFCAVGKGMQPVCLRCFLQMYWLRDC